MSKFFNATKQQLVNVFFDLSWVRYLNQKIFSKHQPREKIHLDRKCIYILPTLAGCFFAGIALALLIASINYKINLGYWFVFLLFGLGHAGLLFCYRNLSQLTLEIIRTENVFAGEIAYLQINVINQRNAPRFAISVASQSRHSIQIPTHWCDILENNTHTIRLSIPTHIRGELVVPRLNIATSFPLGLFRAWTYWIPKQHAIVYPTPEANCPPLPEGYNTNELQSNNTITINEGQEDFAGLRPYAPGDSMRRIHWKSAARFPDQPLRTVLFSGGQQTIGDRIWLDWRILPQQLGYEEKISRLTAWILQAETQQRPYGLKLLHQIIEPALGLQHQERCLTALAKLTKHENMI